MFPLRYTTVTFIVIIVTVLNRGSDKKLTVFSSLHFKKWRIESTYPSLTAQMNVHIMQNGVHLGAAIDIDKVGHLNSQRFEQWLVQRGQEARALQRLLSHARRVLDELVARLRVAGGLFRLGFLLLGLALCLGAHEEAAYVLGEDAGGEREKEGRVGGKHRLSAESHARLEHHKRKHAQALGRV